MADIPCPACAKPIPAGSQFCPSCGQPAPAPAAAGFCTRCGKPLPPGGHFCTACGAPASATSAAVAAGVASPPPPPAGSPPAAAPAKKSGGCFQTFLILFAVVFVVGVAGQLGWDWWKGRERKAGNEAFYALARPLLGTWKVIQDPGTARYTYTTRFRPNQSSHIPKEAPETLFVDCVENGRAPQWTFSSAADGRLVGGGLDQTAAGSDFSLAHGTAEVSPDGRRLTLRMIWDSTREVTTVLERAGPAPEAAK